MFHLRRVSVSAVDFFPFLFPLGPSHHLILLACIVVLGLPFPVHLSTMLSSTGELRYSNVLKLFLRTVTLLATIVTSGPGMLGFLFWGPWSLWCILYKCTHMQPPLIVALPWDRHEHPCISACSYCSWLPAIPVPPSSHPFFHSDTSVPFQSLPGELTVLSCTSYSVPLLLLLPHSALCGVWMPVHNNNKRTSYHAVSSDLGTFSHLLFIAAIRE